MDASAPQLDLTIHRGASFNIQLAVTEDDDVTPVDLTGHEITASIRRDYTQPVLDSFIVTPVNLSLGAISLLLTNEQNAALPLNRFVYDVKMVDPAGYVTYLMRGRLMLINRVTI